MMRNAHNSATITLTLDEINRILAILGNLPTSSAVFPLAVKIKQQAEAQLPKPEANEED